MSLPRLLAGIGDMPITYDRHLRTHGDLTTGATALATTIARSGLRGRGGGGFPLAIKIAAVRRARGTPILIVNGCEGEPMSTKDRLLLSATPHLALDGAFGVARAIGAAEVIALDQINVRTGEAVQAALAERPELARDGVTAQTVWVPGGYVSGQETALVRWCNTGVARPLPATPRVTERGVGGRPTLVSNAETLAHVALIAGHGADWFRALGIALDRISLGSAEPDSLERVIRWCELSAGRGACAHPDGTAGFVTSALKVFAGEFLDHAQYGPCDGCDRSPVLSTPLCAELPPRGDLARRLGLSGDRPRRASRVPRTPGPPSRQRVPHPGPPPAGSPLRALAAPVDESTLRTDPRKPPRSPVPRPVTASAQHPNLEAEPPLR